jgi:integrase
MGSHRVASKRLQFVAPMLPRETGMKRFTDRYLEALKPAPEGKRYMPMDPGTPNLGVEVNDKGRKVFKYVARFPGTKAPARRSLGVYDLISLADAREKAEKWRKLIAKGIDPKDQEAEERAKEQTRRDNTFASVVTDYIKLAVVGWDPDDEEDRKAHQGKAPHQRKGLRVARELRKEFVNTNGKRPGLGPRPIDSITRADITRVLDDAKKRGAPYMAHNLLQTIRPMFNWAIERGVYGLDASPCDRLKPGRVIGKKALRTRVLADDELFALWRAASRLPYPSGAFTKLLALTGQRRTEVGSMRWREIDLVKREWSIPAERMKMGAPHVVPLSAEAVAILKELPRLKGGDFVFSTTFGEKPINGYGKPKERLDARMLRTLKAMTRRRGEDPASVELPDWVFHDVRRTLRTGLSSLKVSTEVAELVIGHAKQGLQAVYNQHQFTDEKRDALELWAGRLRDIVTPAPDNLVKLQARR